MCRFTFPRPGHQLEMSGQLYVPAALLLGKETPLPIRWEVGWAPETVWPLWRRENSWRYRGLKSDPSAVQSVASCYTNCAIPPWLSSPRSLWATASTIRGLLFIVPNSKMPQILHNIIFSTRRNVWLLDDEAPARSSGDFTSHFNNHYPGHPIGRNGPVCGSRDHPTSFLPTSTFGDIWRVQFTPSDVTCGTRCGTPLKQLQRKYATFVTSSGVSGILGATGISCTLSTVDIF
jgi:hypothetical protein